MSLAEIERFATDLRSSEALRAEATKAQADKSPATPVDRAVAFAASKGYAFTADEVKEHAKARKLTDAELGGVAGGTPGSGAPSYIYTYFVGVDNDRPAPVHTSEKIQKNPGL